MSKSGLTLALAALVLGAGLSGSGAALAAGDSHAGDRRLEKLVKQERAAVAGFVQSGKRMKRRAAVAGYVSTGGTAGFTEQLRQSGLYDIGSNRR